MFSSCFGGLCSPAPELPGYKVVKKLGEGACGAVWLADDLSHAQHRVAIKCLPAPGGSTPPPLWAVEAAEREAVALSAVGWGHVNLIRPLELLLTDTYLALVLRYCRGGTLEAYCRNHHISEDLACYLLHQLVNVVEHLHRNNIAYRDLKLENVLLDKPPQLFGEGPPPRLVLADFGCAKRFRKGEAPLTGTFLGTPGFMSPQVLATMGNRPALEVPPPDTDNNNLKPLATISCPSSPVSADADAAAADFGSSGAAAATAGTGAAAARAAEAAAGAAAAAAEKRQQQGGSHSRSASMHSCPTGRFFDAFKADSWALGALLHYMLFGELPYAYDRFAPLLPPQEALMTLLQLEHFHTWREAAEHPGSSGGGWWARGRKISPEAHDLLDQLLHPDEQQRLAIGQIRSHPWLQRKLPAEYSAALQDLQEQQRAMNAAARSTNTREARRLMSQAVHKVFDLSRSPTVLQLLKQQAKQQQQLQQQRQGKAKAGAGTAAAAAGMGLRAPSMRTQSQQQQQQQQWGSGVLSVPLLALRRTLKAGYIKAGLKAKAGQKLQQAASGALSTASSGPLSKAWSLEAALAVEVVEAGGAAAGAAVVETGGAAAGAAQPSNGSVQVQQQLQQTESAGPFASAAAAGAAAAADGLQSATQQQQQQQQEAAAAAGGSGRAPKISSGSVDLVRQQLLQVLSTLDKAAAAAVSAKSAPPAVAAAAAASVKAVAAV